MTDYAERQRKIKEQNRKRYRKQRRDNLLVKLIVALTVVGGLIGVMLFGVLFGSIGIYLGWNLGVYGLAQAVHTHVGHISYWTAFGASFAISAIRQFFSEPSSISFKRAA